MQKLNKETLEYKFKIEWIQALLQGKELNLQSPEVSLRLIPPAGGVFMTHKEFHNFRERSYIDALSALNYLDREIGKDSSFKDILQPYERKSIKRQIDNLDSNSLKEIVKYCEDKLKSSKDKNAKAKT